MKSFSSSHPLSCVFRGWRMETRLRVGVHLFHYATVAVRAADRFVRVCWLVYFGCPKAEVRLWLMRLEILCHGPLDRYSGTCSLHFMRPTPGSLTFTFTTMTHHASNDKVAVLESQGWSNSWFVPVFGARPQRLEFHLSGPYGESTIGKKP